MMNDLFVGSWWQKQTKFKQYIYMYSNTRTVTFVKTLQNISPRKSLRNLKRSWVFYSHCPPSPVQVEVTGMAKAPLTHYINPESPLCQIYPFSLITVWILISRVSNVAWSISHAIMVVKNMRWSLVHDIKYLQGEVLMGGGAENC